jgi:hypothetical protein
MASFLNQHSFAIAAAASFVGLALYLVRDGLRPADVVALVGLALGLGLAFLAFRPGPSTLAVSVEVERVLSSGRPVLLEFQSPY